MARRRSLAGPPGLWPWLLVAGTAFLACAGSGGREARSAYLQQGTHDAVVIAWRSREPAVGTVAWGTSPEQLDRVVVEDGAARDHAVRLEGLPAGQRIFYGYTEGDAPLRTGPGQHYDPAPPPGTDGKVSFWVLGDSGKGNAAQRAVADAMRAYPGTADADFLLHVGDIAYEDGETWEFDERFFAVYADLLLRLPVWPAMGNHEQRSSDSSEQSGPWFEAFVLPADGEAGGVPSGTEAYYSFDFGPVHVVVLDTAGSSLSRGSRMLDWLDRDLAASTAPWTIAALHHAPYSRGTHDSDREQPQVTVRENLVPILDRHGVDLVFAGHSHSYERSALISGAWDTPTRPEGHILDAVSPYEKRPGPYGGTVYVVAGHGGAGTGGRLDHPLILASSLEHGAVFVELEGNEAVLRNVQADRTIGDEVRLIERAP